MSNALKGSIISLVAIISFATLASYALAATPTTIDVPAECSDNAASPVLTVTQKITEADTGHHGTWATDSFTETAKIYTANAAVTATYAYCVVGTIDAGGTFTTTGPNSPENGDPLAAGITGTITGGETWLIPAGTTIEAGITDSTYEAAEVNAPTEDSKFSNWQNEVFGGTTGANTFSFTYVADADSNITWLNDGAGNDGDITNPSLSTVYVDTDSGNDSNIGDSSHPFQTLEKAVSAVPSGGVIKMTGSETLSSTITISQPLTIDGQNSATLVVPSTITGNDALDVKADDVTIQNLTITGPADGTSYLSYAWGGTITRGIFVYTGHTGFNITGNTIQGLRNNILVDGRDTGSITNNTIDNSKSGISVQYTDAGTGNTEGYTIDISGNKEGQFGNEWGVNMHLNGHDDGTGNLVGNSVKIAAVAPTDVQDALKANSAANNGWTVQDQGYSTSNRTAVTVASTGSDSNQGSQLSPLATIQTGVDAVVTGGTVNVQAGNYTGNVTINRPVVLKGPNADIDPTTGTARGSEATITGQVNVYAGDTLVSGFTITNPSWSGATIKGAHVWSDGPVISNITLKNNIFTDINNGNVKGAYGVMVQGEVDNVSVTGNLFDGITSMGWAHAVEVTPTSNDTVVPTAVSITGNAFHNITNDGGDDQYAFSLDLSDSPGPTVYADASQATFNHNIIDGVPVRNLDTSHTLDASHNWWGTTDGSSIALLVSGDVTYSPWYTSMDMTTTDDGTTVTTTTSSETTLSGNSNASAGTVQVTATIAAGTVISADSGWDGIINPPTATSVTLNGYDVFVAVELGSPDFDLTLSQPARIVLPGQAGKHVGFFNHAGDFTEINNSCSSDDVSTSLPASGVCKLQISGDVVIWTTHFSVYVSYQSGGSTSSTSGGGGGGGGGGGPVVALPNNGGAAPTTPTNTNTGTTGTVNSGGQVLGAATYNFTTDLTIGSRGADVDALQQVLIDEGFLAIEAPTGYFGALTKAAVVKYQTAHGITPQSGYVGPKTRTVLNAGTTPTMSDEQRSLLIAELEAKLEALLAQIRVLLGAQQ